MLLKALDPTIVCRDQSLNHFLAQDRNVSKQLGPCSVTKIKVSHYVGSGAEGLVLACRVSGNDSLVALKLFFQGHRSSDPYKIWPLKNEAVYYASCARYKAHISKPGVLLPTLPKLSYTKWAQVHDNELFKTIDNDIQVAPQEAAERDEILPVLEQMCADGWIAFDVEICRKLRGILPKDQFVKPFTGDIIIGIVKPFFKEEVWTTSFEENQIQTMLLMRAFGWRLREVESRNWINGCLVDGADVDTRPRDPRYFDRYWTSVFCQFIRQVKAEQGDELVGDRRVEEERAS